MAYEQVFAKSIGDFHDAVAKHAGKRIIAIFSGSLDENGESWCPDCRVAEPVIEACLEHVKNAVVLYCEVGARAEWKDPENAFRKDEKLRIKCVPTLLDFSSGQRLEEEQCADADLVKMLFEEGA